MGDRLTVAGSLLNPDHPVAAAIADLRARLAALEATAVRTCPCLQRLPPDASGALWRTTTGCPTCAGLGTVFQPAMERDDG